MRKCRILNDNQNYVIENMINNLIENKRVQIIDIKFSTHEYSAGGTMYSVMIVYEEQSVKEHKDW